MVHSRDVLLSGTHQTNVLVDGVETNHEGQLMNTLCLADEMKMLRDALEFITIFYLGLIFSTSA